MDPRRRYRSPVRNRYLDLLRAAAIVRVVVYHLFGWPWLSIVFPAMGVMFAVAGSLTAASLQKRAAGPVVASRLRRLLPPLWMLAAFVVPAMVATGWEPGRKVVFWLLPLGDPPGSQAGVDAWEPLWYIRAYLWFVLLTPLLWAAWKRLGGAAWLLVAAPVLAIAVLDRTGFALPETPDTVMWDLVTYGACWIIGFAHRDGRLARLRPGVVVAAVAVLGGAALYWQSGHPGEEHAWDLNDVAESQALWSLAFVLLVLRWQPNGAALSRFRPLNRAVEVLNARAVTVYLWHNLAIAAIWPVLTWLALDDLGRLEKPVTLVMAFALTGVAVLAFGWVEDVAARRRPRLWPRAERPAPPVPEPSPAPMPAGWPERTVDDTSDLPVAGRTPTRGYDGVPWTGRGGPRHRVPGPGEPMPLRFTGGDGENR